MPPFRPLVRALTLGLLAAGCAKLPVLRNESPALPAKAPRRIMTARPELREAQRPVYARSAEIWQQTPDGALWSDQPARALTRDLAREISRLSTALAVAEPCPLDTPPESRLELRLDRLHAAADGRFVMAGRYFLTRGQGAGDRVGRFDIAMPLAGTGAPGSPAAIAAARGPGRCAASPARSSRRSFSGGRHSGP